jgi:hypothetical protein
MIQTLEAIVNEAGKISLLTEVRLKTSRRALVTILDEEPKAVPPVSQKDSQKEKLRAVFGKMHNVEMFRGIEDVKAWQKELRDEWD